jgi:hypothetical protein
VGPETIFSSLPFWAVFGPILEGKKAENKKSNFGNEDVLISKS